MKIYTIDELKVLSAGDVLNLVSFEASNNTRYFYSDIRAAQKRTNDFIIALKSSDTYITTTDENKFNEILLGKANYDLIGKTLEAVNEYNVNETKFFNSINATMNNMKDSFSNSLNNTTQTISNSSSVLVSDIHKMSEQAIENINSTINKLNDFDKRSFDIKMEKIDQIINIFGTLLEDK